MQNEKLIKCCRCGKFRPKAEIQSSWTKTPRRDYCSLTCLYVGWLADKAPNPASDPDMINPEHYKVGGVENWDYLVAKLTPEELKGHCKACIIKYLARAKHKGSELENYRKAQWYMDKLVEAQNA